VAAPVAATPENPRAGVAQRARRSSAPDDPLVSTRPR
jgi:hypothetical protein